MRTHKTRCRTVQKIQIQGIIIVKRAAAQKRTARPRVPDPVFVFLSQTGIARVKRFRHFPDIENGGALREKMIQRRHETFAGNGMLRAHAHTKAFRMDAGIGPAASLAVRAFSQHTLHSVLKRLLHAGGIFCTCQPWKQAPS